MSEEHYRQRAGDADRDDAVALLQDHLADGRLDHAEFDERISAALQAKTQQQLQDLFTDLPGRRPGEPALPAAPVTRPLPADRHGTPAQAERPWYAQWWLILVAVAVAALTRGRLGAVVPLMAVWLWLVWPALARRARGN